MIRLKVPATSANIGPGFDSLGLAVNLYNEVTMEEYDGISITALDGAAIPTDASNMVYAAAKQLYEYCGKPFYGLRITQVNRIPFTRGLGSSSACIIAGLKGANRLLNCSLSDGELIDLAAEMEGHPDNTTPALTGGLVTAVIDHKKVYYVKQEIRDDLQFVAIIPDFELRTSKSRAVLPTALSRKDSVYNLSRAALMSVSLYSGNYQNLAVAAKDRLHQPYRLGLIKGAQEVMQSCYEFGAYAAYLSGAGPTIMAIADLKKTAFEREMRARLQALGLSGWQVLSMHIDNEGTVVEQI